MSKWFLICKLNFLKGVFVFVNAVSNLFISNTYLSRKKLVLGITILSISASLASSCNTGKTGSAVKTTIEEPIAMCYDVAIDPQEPTPMIVEEQMLVDKTVNTDDTLIIAEKMPEFIGGVDSLKHFIAQNLKKPENFPDVTGKVYVSFVITAEGKVINPVVVRSLDPVYDEEAIRVVKLLPDWIPGKHNGIPVNVKYIIPVPFIIEK